MPDKFHAAMADAHISALWERTHGADELAESPHLWQWSALDPLLDAAVEATGMDDAERRVLVLENPAYRDSHRRGAGPNMVVNLQILMPGESARPHRHSLNALRFVIEGEETAVTIVDGIPCPMLPGDFLLTPGWCWHEHSHNGNHRAVWLDALDAPLQTHLGTNEFQPGPSNDMPDIPPEDAFASAGVTPIIETAEKPYSPIFRTPRSRVEDALAAMPEGADGGRRIRYTNPRTGGAAMPGLDCYMLAPPKARDTRPYRTNANMVCLAVDGEGETRFGDETLRWRKNDLFSLPRNHWISHRGGSDMARLFQLTDREVLARLDYLKEEFRD